MKFIQAGACDPMTEPLLRDRLYAAAFTWFYYEPMWYSYDALPGNDAGTYGFLYIYTQFPSLSREERQYL